MVDLTKLSNAELRKLKLDLAEEQEARLEEARNKACMHREDVWSRAQEAFQCLDVDCPGFAFLFDDPDVEEFTIKICDEFYTHSLCSFTVRPSLAEFCEFLKSLKHWDIQTLAEKFNITFELSIQESF